MANYEYTVTFSDGKQGSRPTTVSGYLIAADEADAVSTLQGIVEAMNNPAPAGVGALALTLGKVVSVSLNLAVDFSGWAVRSAAAAGAENQKGGRFIFSSALGYKAMQTLPTFNEALKLDTGYIDIANPAVFAFFNTAIIANGGATNHFEDLTTLDEAYFTYSGKPAYK